jgi:hypothetical protein
LYLHQVGFPGRIEDSLGGPRGAKAVVSMVALLMRLVSGDGGSETRPARAMGSSNDALKTIAGRYMLLFVQDYLSIIFTSVKGWSG